MDKEEIIIEVKRLDTELDLINHIINNIEIKDRWLLDLRLAKQVLRINYLIEYQGKNEDYFN